MKCKVHLMVERLEDRFAPASFGGAWPDPEHLTLSFVPDGTTSVEQTGTSQLFATLRAQSSDPAWQTAILRAFQSWAVNANINIGLVPDSGIPLGSNGAPQRDPRFGDFRVGTFPLAANSIAQALPFNVMAGTWGGDVKLNPSFFGTGSKYDLYSVMLHEVGHALGLADNADPFSALYNAYAGARSGPSAEDIAQLQSLYGVRQPDAFDAVAPNDSLATATRLRVGCPIQADLTTLQDVDFYQFKVPDGVTGATIALHTAGVSLLVPQLSVFNAKGKLIQRVTSTGPLYGDLSIALDRVVPGTTYFIKVERASADVFGIGSYQLSVSGKTGVARPAGFDDDKLYPLALTQLNSYANSPTTINLEPHVYRSSGLFNYTVQGNLTESVPVQTYRFKTPRVGGDSVVITIMAWASKPGSFTPSLAVYDCSGLPVAANVLVNDFGTYTLQVPKAALNTFYSVAVTGPEEAGGYFLAIDFDIPVQSFQSVINGAVLNATDPTQYLGLKVTQSQLLHFELAVSGPATAGLQWLVYDESKNVVLSTTVMGGQTITRNLYLKPGVYFFRFTALNSTPVTFSLGVIKLTDPIGPGGSDPTLDPQTTTDQTYTWLTWDTGLFLYLAYLD